MFDFHLPPARCHLLWGEVGGWQGWDGGGVGRLFSNYAVWNNHAGDISKPDLLSRRCGAQRNAVDGRWDWTAAISPAVLVTAAPAATSNSWGCFYSHKHRIFWICWSRYMFMWMKIQFVNAAVGTTCGSPLALPLSLIPSTLMHRSPRIDRHLEYVISMCKCNTYKWICVSITQPCKEIDIGVCI